MKKRRCKQKRCKTILSRFNPSKWCSIHEREHPPVHASQFVGKRSATPNPDRTW